MPVYNEKNTIKEISEKVKSVNLKKEIIPKFIKLKKIKLEY